MSDLVIEMPAASSETVSLATTLNNGVPVDVCLWYSGSFSSQFTSVTSSSGTVSNVQASSNMPTTEATAAMYFTYTPPATGTTGQIAIVYRILGSNRTRTFNLTGISPAATPNDPPFWTQQATVTSMPNPPETGTSFTIGGYVLDPDQDTQFVRLYYSTTAITTQPTAAQIAASTFVAQSPVGIPVDGDGTSTGVSSTAGPAGTTRWYFLTATDTAGSNTEVAQIPVAVTPTVSNTAPTGTLQITPTTFQDGTGQTVNYSITINDAESNDVQWQLAYVGTTQPTVVGSATQYGSHTRAFGTATFTGTSTTFTGTFTASNQGNSGNQTIWYLLSLRDSNGADNTSVIADSVVITPAAMTGTDGTGDYGFEIYDSSGTVIIRGDEILGKALSTSSISISGTSGSTTMTIPADASTAIAIPEANPTATEVYTGRPSVTISGSTVSWQDADTDQFDRITLIYF